MKKILIYVFLGVVCLSAAKAQQLQMMSQFQLHNFMYNAGAAGMSGHSYIGGTYRTMWSGISGSPKTAQIYGSGYINKMNIGYGGILYNDKTGPTSRTGVQAAVAYHVQLNTRAKLGVGIELRGLQFSIDRAKLSETIPNDPVLAGASNRFKFDVGAGVYYNDDKLQLGFGVSQLAQSQLGFGDGTGTSERAKLYRHYYGIASYVWRPDENTQIIPNFLGIFLPNAPSEYVVGAKFIHRETFWWGLNLHLKQSWSLQAGYIFNKKLSVGYSYDIYRTPLSIYYTGSGAHEINLRYDFLK